MRARVAIAVALLCPMLATAPSVLAAGPPSISIVSPSNGTTVSGSSVSVTVSVSNFKLVPPVYVNPPKLPGNQGHIHYVLDNLANFVATRDARASLSHTWTNVAPGRHTIIAYLATSQHAQFPGTQRAMVQVIVSGKPAGGAPPEGAGSAAKAPAAPKPKPAMNRLATTGGAAGLSRPGLAGRDVTLGLLCLALGLGLLTLLRRTA